MAKKKILGILALVTILSSVAGYSFTDSAIEKGHIPDSIRYTEF